MKVTPFSKAYADSGMSTAKVDGYLEEILETTPGKASYAALFKLR